MDCFRGIFENFDLNKVFIFTPFSGPSRGFTKVLKSFIKPFKVPQRGMKVKTLSN